MFNFLPTYLYVKQHKKTGLKYFGKTTKKNPVKYQGSGKYWKLHLKNHGNDIETLWYYLFNDKEQLVEYAIKFSIENNIYESSEWANLKLENGLDGGHLGVPRTEETKKKLSKANLGKIHNEDTKLKISNSNIGKHSIPKNEECKHKIKEARKLQIMKPHSEETKLKMSQPRGKQISCFCILCRKEISVSNIRKHYSSCQ